MKARGLLVLCGLLTFPLWLVVASYIYCRWSGHSNLFVSPYAQWLLLAMHWQRVPLENQLRMAGSALIPTLVVALTMRLCWLRYGKKLSPTLDGSVRPIVRGPTDNLGHADWLSRDEMLRLFPGPQGMLIGAVDPGPESPVLVDTMADGPTHSLVFAGSGSFKTVSVIHRLWLWPGSMVVFDPSVEIGPVMAQALRNDGYTVHEVKLGSPGINVLDWIDVTDPEFEVHIRSAVDAVYDEEAGTARAQTSQKDPFWGQWGKNLVVCLLAALLTREDNPAVPKTLKTLRAGIRTPENVMQTVLETINATSRSAMARDLASGLMAMKAQNTFSSIYSHAFGATSWLSTEVYADLVSGDGLRTSDVLNGKVAIFVQLTLPTLQSTPAIGRAILNALLKPVFRADGAANARVLYLMDEAWVYGKPPEVFLGYTTGRKYVATMCTVWASEASFKNIWGADAGALRNACSWISHAAIMDYDEAEGLSKAIGEHAVLTYSEGSNSGLTKPQGALWGSRNTGTTSNVSETQRRLIKADEIMRSPPNMLFVLARGVAWPIRAYAAPYFNYEQVAELMADNRFRSNAA